MIYFVFRSPTRNFEVASKLLPLMNKNKSRFILYSAHLPVILQKIKSASI